MSLVGDAVQAYNTQLFALFAFLGLDTITAAHIVLLLEEFDLEKEEEVNVRVLALKYGGKHLAHVMPILFVLFERLWNRMEQDANAVSYDALMHNVVIDTLVKALGDVFAPYFPFMCFLLQLLTIEETDFVEYLFWLLTKGERTLDRGEVAMLMQMMLGDKKDEFVTRHKDIIEKLLVEQGSEAIVLNRFQLLNASFAGVFTRPVKDLQHSLLQHLLQGSKTWKELLPKISKALYTESDEAYARTKSSKKININATMAHERHYLRKDIRRMLRLTHHYYNLKQNTTLLFKGSTFRLSKFVGDIVGKLTKKKAVAENASPAEPSTGSLRPGSPDKSLESLMAASEHAPIVPEQPKRNRASKHIPAWLGQLLGQKTGPLSAVELALQRQAEEEAALRAIAQMSDAELDPFKFETEFAYTLDLTVEELRAEAKDMRREAKIAIQETTWMLEDLQHDLALTFDSLGISYKISSSWKQMSNRKLIDDDPTDDNASHHNGSVGSGARVHRQHSRRSAKRGMSVRFDLDNDAASACSGSRKRPGMSSKKHKKPEEVSEEEQMMRDVQELGAKTYNTSSKKRTKQRRRSSFFAGANFTASFRRKTPTPSQQGNDHHSDSSISSDEHNENDDDDDNSVQPYQTDVSGSDAGQPSRAKGRLMADLAQAKGLKKLSSFLSTSSDNKSKKRSSSKKSNNGSSSKSGKAEGDNDGDGENGDEQPEQEPQGEEGEEEGGSSKKGLKSNTAMGRLKEYQAQRQQQQQAAGVDSGGPKRMRVRTDAEIEADSHAVDQMRAALLQGGNDNEEGDDGEVDGNEDQ